MNKLFSAVAIMTLCLSFMTTSLSAQKNMEEGIITMELTDVKADDPSMQSQLSMMKGSSNIVAFNSEKSMMKMDMMGGMVTMTTISNVADKTGFMLFDMMGSKSKIPIGTKEITEREEAQKEAKMSVKYDKSDTKKIAGYNCYKAEISSPDMKGATIVAYVTEDIQVKADVIQGVNADLLDGFPLEYSIGGPGMSMTYTTTEIKFEVDASIFDVKTDGYKETSMEDFQKSMGAMGGGMGF